MEAELLDLYLTGGRELRAAIAGMTKGQSSLRSVLARWSTLDVICHLDDADANIAHRLKRLPSDERPVFEQVKPDLMQAALAYHERDLEEELGHFDLGRRQITRIPRASPPEAWERLEVVRDRRYRTVS